MTFLRDKAAFESLGGKIARKRKGSYRDGVVRRPIHWTTKIGKAIEAQERMRKATGGRDRDDWVWFRIPGDELVHKFPGGFSLCGLAFLAGCKSLQDLLAMQDEGRKPRYRYCSACVAVMDNG